VLLYEIKDLGKVVIACYTYSLWYNCKRFNPIIYKERKTFMRDLLSKKTLSRQSLLTHDRKRSLAYNEDEQYKSVVSNRAFPSLLKKLDEQES